MVTVVGTLISVVSSLDRVTVKAEVMSVLRDTVAVVVPSASLIESATIAKVSAGLSFSIMLTLSLPLACNGADAVMDAIWLPKTMASSTATMLNAGDVL